MRPKEPTFKVLNGGKSNVVPLVPKSLRRTLSNESRGQYQITRDGADARVACRGCSFSEVMVDDRTIIDKLIERHDMAHES